MTFSETINIMKNSNFPRVFQVYQTLEHLFGYFQLTNKCLRCNWVWRKTIESALNDALRKGEINPRALFEKSEILKTNFTLSEDGKLRAKDCITLATFCDEIFRILSES